MNYNELLPKWAELAPDECWLMTDDTEHWYPGYRLSQYATDPKAPSEWNLFFENNILWAVTQAIEARGWGWNISWTRHLKQYIALVFIPPKKQLAFANEIEARDNQSPGHALLTAYLQALESKVK